MIVERQSTSAREGHLPLRTRLQVRYREQGDGEALVLLHGLTDSSRSFSRILPLLDPDRYRALVYDQRGHGDSDRPARAYTVDQLACDVLAFLDAVGVERATLVGHSLGAFVARRAAALAPARVSRLVLIGTGLSPVNESTLELLDTVRALDDPVSPAFAREFQESTVHVPLDEEFLDEIVAESLKVPARVWRSALIGLLALEDAQQLPELTTPTLIICGDRDAVFPRSAHEALASRMRNTRLVVYPQTGHAAHWERPHRVVRDIEAFMRTS